jgi:hypothetical protein
MSKWLIAFLVALFGVVFLWLLWQFAYVDSPEELKQQAIVAQDNLKKKEITSIVYKIWQDQLISDEAQ